MISMVTLQRIGWKDEPSEETPLDSGNLKQMETNFENFVKSVLQEVIYPVRFFLYNTKYNKPINNFRFRNMGKNTRRSTSWCKRWRYRARNNRKSGR